MAVLALANVSLLLVHFSVHVPWRTVFVPLCLAALALAYHTLGGVFLLGRTLRSWSQSSAAALLDRHMVRSQGCPPFCYCPWSSCSRSFLPKSCFEVLLFYTWPVEV